MVLKELQLKLYEQQSWKVHQWRVCNGWFQYSYKHEWSLNPNLRAKTIECQQGTSHSLAMSSSCMRIKKKKRV